MDMQDAWITSSVQGIPFPRITTLTKKGMQLAGYNKDGILIYLG